VLPARRSWTQTPGWLAWCSHSQAHSSSVLVNAMMSSDSGMAPSLGPGTDS
jgi:hypothetical protein